MARDVQTEAQLVFAKLGLTDALSQGSLCVRSPIDGSELAAVACDSTEDLQNAILRAVGCFAALRDVPAPKRGELIRCFGQSLRAHKHTLGTLISLECGKILQEGFGEVQEMIDICDFAVGLSRQLYGLTIASERRGHRMLETWHPLGPVGVITAFNFPVAIR
jgi:aldehyde dehydrogenase (NAD+)